MSPKLQGLVFLLILFICSACKEEEYSLRNKVLLEGRVFLFDTNQEILDSHEGITVTAIGGPTDASTTTDKDGNYSLLLATGTYDLKLEKEGFIEDRVNRVELLGSSDSISVKNGGVSRLYPVSQLPLDNFTIELIEEQTSYSIPRYSFSFTGNIQSEIDSLERCYMILFISLNPNMDPINDGIDMNDTYFIPMGLQLGNEMTYDDLAYSFSTEVDFTSCVGPYLRDQGITTFEKVYLKAFVSISPIPRYREDFSRDRVLVFGLEEEGSSDVFEFELDWE